MHNIILKGKNLNTFPLRSGTRKIFTFALLLGKKKKFLKNQSWKRTSKTVFTEAMLPYIQSLYKATRTLPKWINKFSKVEGLRPMYKSKLYFSISVVDVVAIRSLSCVPHSATSWTVPRQVSLSSAISWSLLKFMSIEWVILSNHLMLCDPLLLPSIFPRIRIFSSELVFHLKFPKYWSYTFTSDSSKEYSPLGLTGLIFL